MPWRSILVLVLLQIHGSERRSLAEATATLQVGSAAVPVEADDSMVISGGIGPRYSRGQEGELRAVAVVIEGPAANRVAIVACDVLFTPAELVDPALAEIARRTEIPPENVFVHATHTHHAPSTSRIHGCEREPVFCDRLQNAIVESVEQAAARAEGAAVEFVYHLGEEKTVGANSRILLDDGRIHWIGSRENGVRPTGPFDPELPVLGFRRPDGSYEAVLYNHSTHTIGTRLPDVRSPSFYGLAAQELERELGGTVGFLEGASGSTHNIGGVPTATAVERMKEVVHSSLAAAKPRPVDRVVAMKKKFRFRIRQFDEAVEDDKVSSYVRKYAPAGADRTIEIFRRMRAELAPLSGNERETTIGVIRIGDVAIVAVPAEYFTSLGVDIKHRSPFEHTVIAELTNDWIGYLPDREGHRLGGYQTWMGLHSYAEPGTGERMADAVVEMLEQVATR